jgi:CheY-like chemotaxis protein
MNWLHNKQTDPSGNPAPASPALPQALEHLPVALITLQPERRLISANHQASTWFGVGKALEPGKAAAEYPALASLLAKLDATRKHSFKNTRLAVSRFVLSDVTGEHLSVEAFLYQYTDDAARGETLMVQPALFVSETAEALLDSAKWQMTGIMAGNAMHSLNNMLAAAMSNIELALSDPLFSPEIREFLTRARDSISKGAEFTAGFLSLTRESSTQVALYRPDKVVETLGVLMRKSMDRRLLVSLPPAAPDLWSSIGSARQVTVALGQIWLSANSLMPNGGEIKVALANCPATGFTSTGDYIRILFTLPPAVLPQGLVDDLGDTQILPGDTSDRIRLGFWIAKRLISSQKGLLEIQSTASASFISVLLPRATMPGGCNQHETTVMTRVSSRSVVEKGTILLVDDEANIRLTMRAILEFRGYTIYEASLGSQAMELFQQHQASLDLVLLDVNLPDETGWDVLKKMQALRPGIKAVMLSGMMLEGEPSKDKSICGLLLKPFSKDSLLRAVRENLV